MTFFWNGNKSGYVDKDLETYFEEPSDKVVFDEKPEMKAVEVTAAAIEAVKSGRFDMVRVNYANPDMVGHTGNVAATVHSCEIVDKCLGELLDAVEAAGGRWLVTSDHGNADDMVQREKKTFEPKRDPVTKELVPCKSHTLAPVPVLIGGSIPDSVSRRTQPSPKQRKRDPVTKELVPCKSHTLAPVPVLIGGSIPDSVRFRNDADFEGKPGLANITATYINLLGLEAPSFYEKSLV